MSNTKKSVSYTNSGVFDTISVCLTQREGEREREGDLLGFEVGGTMVTPGPTHYRGASSRYRDTLQGYLTY